MVQEDHLDVKLITQEQIDKLRKAFETGAATINHLEKENAELRKKVKQLTADLEAVYRAENGG